MSRAGNPYREMVRPMASIRSTSSALCVLCAPRCAIAQFVMAGVIASEAGLVGTPGAADNVLHDTTFVNGTEV